MPLRSGGGGAFKVPGANVPLNYGQSKSGGGGGSGNSAVATYLKSLSKSGGGSSSGGKSSSGKSSSGGGPGAQPGHAFQGNQYTGSTDPKVEAFLQSIDKASPGDIKQVQALDQQLQQLKSQVAAAQAAYSKLATETQHKPGLEQQMESAKSHLEELLNKQGALQSELSAAMNRVKAANRADSSITPAEESHHGAGSPLLSSFLRGKRKAYSETESALAAGADHESLKTKAHGHVEHAKALLAQSVHGKGSSRRNAMLMSAHHSGRAAGINEALRDHIHKHLRDKEFDQEDDAVHAQVDRPDDVGNGVGVRNWAKWDAEHPYVHHPRARKIFDQSYDEGLKVGRQLPPKRRLDLAKEFMDKGRKAPNVHQEARHYGLSRGLSKAAAEAGLVHNSKPSTEVSTPSTLEPITSPTKVTKPKQASLFPGEEDFFKSFEKKPYMGGIPGGVGYQKHFGPRRPAARPKLVYTPPTSGKTPSEPPKKGLLAKVLDVFRKTADRSGEYRSRDLHAEGEWPMTKRDRNPRYGVALFNDEGKILLREPTNHFDGYHWTLSKGGPDKEEHPLDTAKRELLEETGYDSDIVGHVPGRFHTPTSFGGSSNYYYIGRAKGSPNYDAMSKNGETSGLRWLTPKEAGQHIMQSTNKGGRARDLAAVVRAFREYQRLQAGGGTRADWELRDAVHGHHVKGTPYKYKHGYVLLDPGPAMEKLGIEPHSTYGSEFSKAYIAAGETLHEGGPGIEATQHIIENLEKGPHDAPTAGRKAFWQDHLNTLLTKGEEEDEKIPSKADIAPGHEEEYVKGKVAGYQEAVKSGLSASQLKSAMSNKGNKKAKAFKAQGDLKQHAYYMGFGHGYGQASHEAKMEGAAKAAPEAEIPQADVPAGPSTGTPETPSWDKSVPTTWAQIAGMQKVHGDLGSNGGFWVKDASGQEYLVKPAVTPQMAGADPTGEDHAYNEAAMTAVFDAAGFKVKPTVPVYNPEQQRWYVVSKKLDVSPWKASTANYSEARKGFGFDVLTANWDVAGLVKDNAFGDKEGNFTRIDLGGAGKYRARGGLKATWGKNKVNEHENFLVTGTGTNTNWLYGLPQNSESLNNPEIVASLKAAAEFDLQKARDRMVQEGIPESFITETMNVLTSRQNDIKEWLSEHDKLNEAKTEPPSASKLQAIHDEAKAKAYESAGTAYKQYGDTAAHYANLESHKQQADEAWNKGDQEAWALHTGWAAGAQKWLTEHEAQHHAVEPPANAPEKSESVSKVEEAVKEAVQPTVPSSKADVEGYMPSEYKGTPLALPYENGMKSGYAEAKASGKTAKQLKNAAANVGGKKAKNATTPSDKAFWLGHSHGYYQALKEKKVEEAGGTPTPAPKVEPSISEAPIKASVGEPEPAGKPAPVTHVKVAKEQTDLLGEKTEVTKKGWAYPEEVQPGSVVTHEDGAGNMKVTAVTKGNGNDWVLHGTYTTGSNKGETFSLAFDNQEQLTVVKAAPKPKASTSAADIGKNPDGTYKALIQVKNLKAGDKISGTTAMASGWGQGETVGSLSEPHEVISVTGPHWNKLYKIQTKLPNGDVKTFQSLGTTPMIVHNAVTGKKYVPYEPHATVGQLRGHLQEHLEDPNYVGQKLTAPTEKGLEHELGAYTSGFKYGKEHADSLTPEDIKKLAQEHNKAINSGDFTLAANRRGIIDAKAQAGHPDTSTFKLPKLKKMTVTINDPALQEKYNSEYEMAVQALKDNAIENAKSYAHDPLDPRSTPQGIIQWQADSYAQHAAMVTKQIETLNKGEQTSLSNYNLSYLARHNAARSLGAKSRLDPGYAAAPGTNQYIEYAASKGTEIAPGVVVKNNVSAKQYSYEARKVTISSAKGTSVHIVHDYHPLQLLVEEHKKLAQTPAPALKPVPVPSYSEALDLAEPVKNDNYFSNWMLSKTTKAPHYIQGYIEGKAAAENGGEAGQAYLDAAQKEYMKATGQAEAYAEGKYHGAKQAMADKAAEEQLIKAAHQYDEDTHYHPPEGKGDPNVASDPNETDINKQYKAGYGQGKLAAYNSFEEPEKLDPQIEKLQSDLQSASPGTPTYSKIQGKINGYQQVKEEAGLVATAKAPFAGIESFETNYPGYQHSAKLPYIKGYATGAEMAKPHKKDVAKLQELHDKAQKEYNAKPSGKDFVELGKMTALAAALRQAKDRANNLTKAEAAKANDAHYKEPAGTKDMKEEYGIAYVQGKLQGYAGGESALKAAQDELAKEKSGTEEHVAALGKVHGITQALEDIKNAKEVAKEYEGEAQFQAMSLDPTNTLYPSYVMGYHEGATAADSVKNDAAKLTALVEDYKQKVNSAGYTMTPEKAHARAAYSASRQRLLDLQQRNKLIEAGKQGEGDPHYKPIKGQEDDYAIGYGKGKTAGYLDNGADYVKIQQDKLAGLQKLKTKDPVEEAQVTGSIHGAQQALQEKAEAEKIAIAFKGEPSFKPDSVMKQNQPSYIAGYKKGHDLAVAAKGNQTEIQKVFSDGSKEYMNNTGAPEAHGLGMQNAASQVLNDEKQKAEYLKKAEGMKTDEFFKLPSTNAEKYKIGYVKGKEAALANEDDASVKAYLAQNQEALKGAADAEEKADLQGKIHGAQQAQKMLSVADAYKNDPQFNPPKGQKIPYSVGYVEGKEAAAKMPLEEAEAKADELYDEFLDAPEGSSEEAVLNGKLFGTNQAILEKGGAGLKISTSAPESFLKLFSGTNKFTNIPSWSVGGQKHHYDLREPVKSKASEKKLRGLVGYRVALANARKAASSVNDPTVAKDRASAARDLMNDSLSIAQQGSHLAAIDAYEERLKALTPEEVAKATSVEAEKVVHPSETEAYKKAKEAAAKKLAEPTITSRDLYEKAAEYDPNGDLEDKGANLAWTEEAEKLNKVENEMPKVEIAQNQAKPLTPDQVEYIKQAVSGKGGSFTGFPPDLADWAYNQGRGLGIEGAYTNLEAGATPADVEAEALKHEDLAKNVTGLQKLKEEGVARMLHRMALAAHNGEAFDANGEHLIKTSADSKKPKPTVFVTPKASAAAVSSPNNGNGLYKTKMVSGIPFVDVEPKPNELKAIHNWSVHYRWANNRSSIYSAINSIGAGEDPMEVDPEMTPAGIKHAKTMLRMLEEKSHPSDRTIYRATGGGEFAPGQIQQIMDSVNNGNDEYLDIPVTSHSLSAGKWSGSYKYEVLPGAMTLDIAPYSSFGREDETVTGGLMKVVSIKPQGNGYKIILQQIVHYVH